MAMSDGKVDKSEKRRIDEVPASSSTDADHHFAGLLIESMSSWQARKMMEEVFAQADAGFLVHAAEQNMHEVCASR